VKPRGEALQGEQASLLVISGNRDVFNEFGSSKIFLHRLRMTKGVGVSPMTATFFACQQKRAI
ncbi:MAG: hypothetical protein VYB25_00435, partial [Pseudomonadota bacterium]|nr:hypothetical protein [Pseudomonadota bacterium]